MCSTEANYYWNNVKELYETLQKIDEKIKTNKVINEDLEVMKIISAFLKYKDTPDGSENIYRILREQNEMSEYEEPEEFETDGLILNDNAYENWFIVK